MTAVWLQNWPLRYGLAALSVIVPVLVRKCLGGTLGPLSFTPFPLVIVAFEFLAGVWPSLPATLLSAAFFVTPVHSFAVAGISDAILMIPLAGAGVVIGWFVHWTMKRTTQRKADRSLRLFRTLMDHLKDAVEILDPETLRLLDVNEKSSQDLGYTREELLNLTIFDIDPTVTEASWQQLLEKLKAEKFIVMRSIRRRKDGTTFPVEISLQYVHLDRPYVVTLARDITERERTEGMLRESEDRFRDLVQHSEDLLCTHDLEGNLISVNPAPARILGYSVEELLKIPMRELIVPEGRKAFDDYLERFKTTGAPDKGLMCVLTRTGEVRTWEYVNTLRTDGIDKPIVRGMAHDVTERRRAELALIDSEQRYRTLFEKTVAGVAILGMSGMVVDCNEAWARIFGFDGPSDCRGSSALQHYPDPEVRAKLLEELKQTGFVTNREMFLRSKDGRPLWILANDILLSDAKDQPLVQATVVDITARKLAEAALKQSEERFRVALKASPVAVFNQDLDLRYTWIYNPHIYRPELVVGKTDLEILGPKKAGRLHELKQRVLATGAPAREEIVIEWDGKMYAFDIKVEPLLDADNQIVGITGSAIDIARLRILVDGLQSDKDKLAQEKSYLEGEIQTELGFEEIIGQSPALREVLKKARIVAPTDSTVLLLGETGTGKELVARSVHSLSTRHDKTFVKLNCAAVPSGLLESELFGHEKGAFTGAVNRKIGRIELADKGTLFLDEIGELPLELQPKLLRVLQDREFERLGGIHTLKVDVRIISATNRDLRQDVAQKEFREDLFYRLNVFPISLPPLRERRTDVPILVHHFVRKHSLRAGKHIDTIPGETMKVLQNWSWPGNVRELENMIERMVILTNGAVLAPPPAELEEAEDSGDSSLTEMERDHIVRILRRRMAFWRATTGQQAAWESSGPLCNP
jgi:PAS domain S-box-containing protein